MSDKLQKLIDSMMKEFGFDFPEELIKENRKRRIIVVDDDTGEVVEVLREASDDTKEESVE